MRAAPPHLSVVVPLRDERASLEALYRELDAALADLAVAGRAAELIFVDDGSRDGSAALLCALAARDARVRVLRLASPRGQSAACDAGFRAARGELVATLDADGQNDPADLPRLLAALEAEAADAVCGVRVRRRDGPARRLAGRAANAVRNAVTGEAVRDVGCSLRVMRRACLERLPPFDGVHRFLPTFLGLAGARVIERPVNHRPRRAGRSKYGIAGRLRAGVLDVLGVWWLKRRWLAYETREAPRIVARAPAGENLPGPERAESVTLPPARLEVGRRPADETERPSAITRG